MLAGRTVFAELLSHVSPQTFRTCVARYDGNYKASRFSCWDRYLCLSVFPWAHDSSRHGAVKLHTLLDLRGQIPTVIHITPGKRSEIAFLDDLVFEAGAFYLMDRG